MSNSQQYPNQKTQDDRYTTPSKPAANPSQQTQENPDPASREQKGGRNGAPDSGRHGGMKGDPVNEGGTRREEREEEDRPRAGKK